MRKTGREPFAINSNRQGIVFDNGFLFSTPGKSGIVGFHDSSRLAAGMGHLNRAAYLDYGENVTMTPYSGVLAKQ
jgi:hypothetical protein